MIERLTGGQRAVLVISYGLVVAVVATLLLALWSDRGHGGWFAYAPNTGVTFPEGADQDWPAVRAAVTWLGAITAWAGPSLWAVASPFLGMNVAD